jgi:hypothetical protein
MQPDFGSGAQHVTLKDGMIYRISSINPPSENKDSYIVYNWKSNCAYHVTDGQTGEVELSFMWDEKGNISRIETDEETVDYSYTNFDEIESIHYFDKAGTLMSQVVMEYDSENRPVSSITYGQYGQEQGRMEQSFNEYGDLLRYTSLWGGYLECDDVYTYEYDAEGHLVKVFESYENSEPELKSVMTWTNGNLTSWTRENRIENEDGTKSPEIKVQTYTEEVNTAGIHTAYNDKNANLSKWMLELGFFGKASKNLLNTDKWSNAEKDAKFEYRYDDDNYVVAEIKYYMNDDLTTYKLDDENYFLWEAAE